MIYFSMKELLWKQIIKKKKKPFFFGMLKNNHRLKTRFNKKKKVKCSMENERGMWKLTETMATCCYVSPCFRHHCGDNASVHCLDNLTWFCTSFHGMSGQQDHCLLQLAVILHTPRGTEYFYPQHHTVKDFGTEGFCFFCRMFTIS